MSQLNYPERHYNICVAINQHNCHRQNTFNVEWKMQRQSGDKCVITSIFRMYCVDVWLIYCGFSIIALYPGPEMDQREFYCVVAEELVDKTISILRNRRSKQQKDIRATRSRKRHKYGTITKSCSQEMWKLVEMVVKHCLFILWR